MILGSPKGSPVIVQNTLATYRWAITYATYLVFAITVMNTVPAPGAADPGRDPAAGAPALPGPGER